VTAALCTQKQAETPQLCTQALAVFSNGCLYTVAVATQQLGLLTLY
jgi:hypothetical protein